jgi:hypothetical protein
LTSLLGASAVTFGRYVFLSRGAAAAIANGSDCGRRLLRHELAHVEQYTREGFFPFLRRYLAAYIRGRRQGLSHIEAYAAIPYEREAERAEERIADS